MNKEITENIIHQLITTRGAQVEGIFNKYGLYNAPLTLETIKDLAIVHKDAFVMDLWNLATGNSVSSVDSFLPYSPEYYAEQAGEKTGGGFNFANFSSGLVDMLPVLGGLLGGVLGGKKNTPTNTPPPPPAPEKSGISNTLIYAAIGAFVLLIVVLIIKK